MKAFDISKYRKTITKNITGVSTGFRDPKIWLSTGNYALNYKLTGDFYKGIPLGKVTMLAGQSGAGKSFVASGNLVREAQKQGIFVVLIDSENALDKDWLENLGVDTSEDKLLKINAAMVDDVAVIIDTFMDDYKKEYDSEPEDERPKVLFVVDSLGMLMTPTEREQFQKGDMKGDMGRKAKQLKALIINCVNMFGAYDVGMIVTNHSYQSQDMFNPDDVISGGQGMVYASSIVLAMKKLNLKEDEKGDKTSKVHGIRSKIKIMKSRFSKPFETVEIKIPYDRGMDPYSGMRELCEEKNVITKTGNKWVYVDKDGNEHKYFEKAFNRNDDQIIDLIMSEWNTDAVEYSVDEDTNDTE